MARTIPRMIRRLIGPALLVLLVVWMLHKSLFSGGVLVPARLDSDLHREFLGWRSFGFGELLHGRLPFWNPHVFCGIPFFAQIQSSLLYPISWVNFVFNSATATTLEIAASICIAALSTYTWGRQRGISRCGAMLAGAAFAFSGPIYLRVMAGHVSTLATMSWMPIVFLALDRLLVEKFISGICIGAMAVCLQWLGGHPQMTYYTAMVAGLYVILQSHSPGQIVKCIGGFIALYLLGTMLAAAQVIPSYLAAQLTIRAGRAPYAFSSSLSFAPESLLSFLIPYPFGDASHVAYVGRWFLWEMSAYVGVINLALAAIGLVGMPGARGKNLPQIRRDSPSPGTAGEGKGGGDSSEHTAPTLALSRSTRGGNKNSFSTDQHNDRWRMILLLGAILLLMLGSYTPLHGWLYQYLPGFGMFRGASKFNALLALMLSILAGEGFDRIRRGFSASAAIAAAIAGGISLILAVILFATPPARALAGELLNIIWRSNQYFDAQAFALPNLAKILTRWIAWQLCIAGALMVGISALMCWSRRSSKAPYILLCLTIAEVYGAALFSSQSSASACEFPMEWIPKIAAATKADRRVLFNDSITFGNQGNGAGYDSLWGYDPGQPGRYTELIASSQGDYSTPRDVYEFSLLRIARIFPLLRCGYVFPDNPQPPIALPEAMPHLQLIGDYIQLTDSSRIVAHLLDPQFDFHRTAILESDPSPAPTRAGAGGRAILLRQSINDLEIEADVPAPALLLISDAYAPGWRVRAIDTNVRQQAYEILPADDVLRGIPLSAGHHHFDLYYIPPGLWAGAGVSALGGALWLVGIFALLFRSTKPA